MPHSQRSSAPITLWERTSFTLLSLSLICFGVSATSVRAAAETPTRRTEIQRALPITKFYDVPDPLPAGKPGILIRSQEFDQYEIPFSMTAVRILYHSRSVGGDDVAASGVVLYPYGRKPPAGGWPVIAWAHGFSGVARACAPSLMRNIGHGPFLSMYVNLGYAVVATDYTGLGTRFRNAFLDGPSNAADVINSIPAARAAVPELGQKWVVLGETEGGLAAVAIAEKENEIRDPNYLGAVAISDMASVKEIFDQSGAGSSSLMLASLAYGIQTVYPHFQASDILTEKGLALYQDVEHTCSETRNAAELSAAQTVTANWQNNPYVHQYFERNRPGQVPAFGPMLVISRDGRAAIVLSATAPAISRMCKQGDRVQWERFPDTDTGSVIGDTVRDQIGWIEARFAGRPPATNCQ